MAKKPIKLNISEEVEKQVKQELRIIALNTAVQVNGEGNPTTAEQIVKDAETYFQFLTK